ncbi:MAG: hypothetical protein ACI9Q9_000714 [Flavobacterium sp.]|jgi:hypothetical protein
MSNYLLGTQGKTKNYNLTAIRYRKDIFVVVVIG